MKVLINFYLAVNAWTDCRRKEIDLRYTGVFVFLVALIQMRKGVSQNWMGIFPGICLCALSLWKGEKIGNGDGVVAIGLGWAIGIRRICEVLTGGFFLAGMYGIVLSMMGRDKTTKIPWIPFLWISFLIEVSREGG